MPKLYNKHKDRNIPIEAVYIGRPSIYGNPFTIGKDGTREEVISKYIQYLKNNKSLVRKIVKDLKGKDLVCYCHPLKCHGDILLKLANYELININETVRHNL
jgi:hypothetical protein